MTENQTIQIETGKELKFENLASFRKKMRQSEIQVELGKFVQFLKDSGAKKNGPMISATFTAEEVDGEQVLDMEFLIPIDRRVELLDEYQWKPLFHLVNSVFSRHVGNLQDIQATFLEMTTYIQNNCLHQITVAYIVNYEENGQDAPMIEIYIGVNPCVT